MHNINYIRLLTIELRGFKNVDYGKIDMPNSLNEDYKDGKADILGIYGQNGSGKTAVIEALSFLKSMMTGQSLPDNAVYYISETHKAASLSFKFYLRSHEREFLVRYEFALGKNEKGICLVTAEKLMFSELNESLKSSEKTLINFNRFSESPAFSPKYRYDELSSGNKEHDVKIGVAKVVSAKDRKSFIFCDELRELWDNESKSGSIWDAILPALRGYAIENLFVIKKTHSGLIAMDLPMPFSVKYQCDKQQMLIGEIPVSLTGSNNFPKEIFDIFKEIFKEINTVIGKLVPNLSIAIHEYGPQLTPDGKEGVRFELVSKRGETEIPLFYESEGIKKIISILNLLIAMYNDPSVCVAIDELDAGVYEYLLGELLGVIEETGKGQLIFTSHNLRPLEMIKKSSMLFTTTNPKNRYIRLTNVKNTNNMRDLYLRSINLGGQKEQVYEPTKEYEIRRAFSRARIHADV